jgi:GDPmannose 4,6-dehydratase
MKRALITGITGQDGSYLAEQLIEKNYEVFGLYRRSSTMNFWRIEHILDKVNLIAGDITDYSSLTNAITLSEPDEIYNLASQSFVGISWTQPLNTLNTTGVSVLNLLEAARKSNLDCKIIQASSSEMFGKVLETPQTETTPFNPRSPYGIAKVMAYWLTINYREAYDMHISNSICFNHESERRGEEFVTRKITLAVTRIALGLQKHLELGNLDAKRDWGYAPDYTRAMNLILQQKKPADYVVATGETHSVKEFVEKSFQMVNIADWQKHVKINPKFFRPTEVDELRGDSSKLLTLGWRSTFTFEEMIRKMIDHEFYLLQAEGTRKTGKIGVTNG